MECEPSLLPFPVCNADDIRRLMFERRNPEKVKLFYKYLFERLNNIMIQEDFVMYLPFSVFGTNDSDVSFITDIYGFDRVKANIDDGYWHCFVYNEKPTEFMGGIFGSKSLF